MPSRKNSLAYQLLLTPNRERMISQICHKHRIPKDSAVYAGLQADAGLVFRRAVGEYSQLPPSQQDDCELAVFIFACLQYRAAVRNGAVVFAGVPAEGDFLSGRVEKTRNFLIHLKYHPLVRKNFLDYPWMLKVLRGGGKEAGLYICHCRLLGRTPEELAQVCAIPLETARYWQKLAEVAQAKAAFDSRMEDKQ